MKLSPVLYYQAAIKGIEKAQKEYGKKAL